MKNRKSKKQKLSPRKLATPRFEYTSVCCKATATKPPCVVPDGTRFASNGVSLEDVDPSSLGTWRCGSCGKVCSVTRATRKVEERPEASA